MKQKGIEPEERMLLAETLNDASIDCVLAMDNDLNICSWNKQCERVLGITKAVAMGQPLTSLFSQLKPGSQLWDALLQASNGLQSFVPAHAASFDGLYSESHVIPLKDENGVVNGILIILHDVAHRMKAEQELARLNASLANKNRELEDRNSELLSFAQITSHDLKEPLRKIQLFSNMLMECDLDHFSEQGKSYFTRIQRAAQKMETLTDDMLTFARINTLAEPETDVNLNHVFKFVENYFRQAIRDCEALVNAQTLPVVRGHRTLLYVLFQHLIGNALKFIEAGQHPNLFIRAGQTDGNALSHPDVMKERTYHWISIEDDGIGFEPQYERQIFEMFRRLDTGNRYPGNGIGLSVCRKIAGLHHGFMMADSMPGKGSVFTCYFPVAA